uniref:Dynein regulatory complex protein 1/2 N-terminal domain-containing protein n=1 Tax=Dendroctonus ponderosae TaxID=77166 RepID=A0AAR5PAR7_DENPD
MDLLAPRGKINKLRMETEQIGSAMKILLELKKEIISKVEETKNTIRNLCTQKSAQTTRPSIVVKDRTVSLLDRDISRIQNLHDIVVQDLQDLRKSLESHGAIVEKTELIMSVLSYKLYEIQFAFRNEFDKLKAKKESLTAVLQSGKEEPTIALRLVETDDEIAKLEDTQQKNSESIKAQKLEAQKAYEKAVLVMDENFEKMSNGLSKLLVLIEAEKSTLSESQAQLVDAKFADQVNQIRGEIEKFTALQTTGWKVLYPEEKLSELLQERGLKILHNGQLITGDGQAITFKQAQQSKLLEDISPEGLNELKANMTADTDESTDTTTSSVSIGSKISSEDVSYLKTCLGKPLALAIAEITTLQPRDPIHYLAHWLFKYRYNQQMEDINSIEIDILTEKRNKLAKERWHKFIEGEAKAAVIDMVLRAEDIAQMNELNRIQRETEAMEEMENFEEEARDTLGPYTGPTAGQMAL